MIEILCMDLCVTLASKDTYRPRHLKLIYKLIHNLLTLCILDISTKLLIFWEFQLLVRLFREFENELYVLHIDQALIQKIVSLFLFI